MEPPLTPLPTLAHTPAFLSLMPPPEPQTFTAFTRPVSVFLLESKPHEGRDHAVLMTSVFLELSTEPGT